MAEPELELETQDEEVVDDTAIEEQPAETPDDTKPEERTDEEVENEVVDEDEDGKYVPTVVRQYHPALAKEWDSLSEAQQQAIQADLMAAIDLGEHDPEGAGDDKGGDKTPAASRKASPGRAAEAAVDFSPPQAISDAELQAAIGELGVEADGPAAKLVAALLAHSRFAVDTTVGIGERALGALTDLGGSVRNVTEEAQLSKALDSHAPDFRGMSRTQAEAIATNAVRIKNAGRAKDFEDAVSLALLDAQKITRTPAKPTGEQRTRLGRLAASLAKPARGKRRGPALPEGPLTIRQIFQHAESHGIPDQ